MVTAIKDRHKVVPAVYVIFRDESGKKVLLSRRFNTGYRDGEYSLPGGHVGGNDEKGGEPAIMAAVREAKEEVGVDIDPKDLRLIHTVHRFSNNPEPHERIDFCFETTHRGGELTNAEPNKCDELCWTPIDNLPKNIVPEVGDMLSQLVKRRSYSSFGFGS